MPVVTAHTCRCGAQWTGLAVAHCGSCHRTFAKPSYFDQHRTAHGEHGTCTPPQTITTRKTGERRLFFRDGMWRGPEMTDEQKEARFGK